MVAAGCGWWRTRQQRKQKILYWFVKTSFAPLPSPPRPRPRRSWGEVRGSGCVFVAGYCCYVHIVSDSGLTATTKNDQSEHFADHNCLIDTFKLWVMQTTEKYFWKVKNIQAIRLSHESILLCPNLMIVIGNESKYTSTLGPTSSSPIAAAVLSTSGRVKIEIK